MTLLENFINLCQSAAKLLLFVQKCKMAAVAILNFIFAQYFGMHVCMTSNLICAKFRANKFNSKRVMNDK